MIFPALLAQFETDLKQIIPGGKRRFNVKVWQADAAVSGEAILHVYVREVARRLFHAEVSLLLEAAAEAYGLDHRAFTEDAVTRRHSRFCRQHRPLITATELCVRELMSARRNGIESDLIPIFLARVVEPIRQSMISRVYMG